MGTPGGRASTSRWTLRVGEKPGGLVWQATETGSALPGGRRPPRGPSRTSLRSSSAGHPQSEIVEFVAFIVSAIKPGSGGLVLHGADSGLSPCLPARLPQAGIAKIVPRICFPLLPSWTAAPSWSDCQFITAGVGEGFSRKAIGSTRSNPPGCKRLTIEAEVLWRPEARFFTGSRNAC